MLTDRLCRLHHREGMPAPLPLDVVRALRGVTDLDRLGVFRDQIIYFDVVSSTNDVAMDMLKDGRQDGTVVLAAAQDRGRGRRGRSWFSPEGSGLYLSFIWRDAPHGLTTLLVGVAAAEALRKVTKVPVDLEWPNDLVVELSLIHI